MRTDIRSETLILADAYYNLRADNDRYRDRARGSIILYRNYSADVDGQELLLKYYYYFSKSTRNLAVET